jgi:hypothetical protein
LRGNSTPSFLLLVCLLVCLLACSHRLASRSYALDVPCFFVSEVNLSTARIAREDAESVHASAFLFVRLFWEMSRRVATGYCPSPDCGSSIICLASVSSTTCPGWFYISGLLSSRYPSAYDDTQHHHHLISRMKTSHVKGNDRSYLLQNAHRVGRLLTSFL